MTASSDSGPVPMRLALASGALAPLVGTAVSFTQTISVLSIVGIVGRGTAAQAVALVSLISLVGNLGQETVVMHSLTRSISSAEAEFRRSRVLLRKSGIAVCLICILGLKVWPSINVAWPTAFLMGIGAATLVIILPSAALLRVRGRFTAAQWWPSLTVIGPMATSAAAVIAFRTTDWALVGWACGAIAVSAWAWVYVSRPKEPRAQSAQMAPDRPSREGFAFGIKGHVGAVLAGASTTIALLVVGSRQGDAQAGDLSIALAFTGVAGLGCFALASPTMIHAARNPDRFAFLKRATAAAAIWAGGFVLCLSIAVQAAEACGAHFPALSPRAFLMLLPYQVVFSVWALTATDLAVRGMPLVRTQSGGVGLAAMLLGLMALPETLEGAILALTVGQLLAALVCAIALARRKTWRSQSVTVLVP